MAVDVLPPRGLLDLGAPVRGRDFAPYFAAVEPVFWKYEGRPHWGKLHALDAARLAALYPRFASSARVRRSLDPHRRLVNAHLAQTARRLAYPRARLGEVLHASLPHGSR